eukprot:1031477-Amphidinium_carterae.2
MAREALVGSSDINSEKLLPLSQDIHEVRLCPLGGVLPGLVRARKHRRWETGGRHRKTVRGKDIALGRSGAIESREYVVQRVMAGENLESLDARILPVQRNKRGEREKAWSSVLDAVQPSRITHLGLAGPRRSEVLNQFLPNLNRDSTPKLWRRRLLARKASGQELFLGSGRSGHKAMASPDLVKVVSCRERHRSREGERGEVTSKTCRAEDEFRGRRALGCKLPLLVKPAHALFRADDVQAGRLSVATEAVLVRSPHT